MIRLPGAEVRSAGDVLRCLLSEDRERVKMICAGLICGGPARRIMREITITSNDAGRRLDRFLRKYLPGASLGEIYKIIRKDVKVDSKRRSESYMLNEGETLTLYLSDETLDKFGAGAKAGTDGRTGAPGRSKAKRNFGIVYEDENILIAGKPFGLLTHGDRHEKKDHLANQVKDHLIATGSYDPRAEKVFSPAPVNRLDRNTTGIVLFGKTAAALRELTRMIREDEISKFYLTIACGIIESELKLSGSLVKDEEANKVSVLENSEGARHIETIVRPLEALRFGDGLTATLCEVELVTGRSHQIRAHLASAGHPLIGDSKYAGAGARAGGHGRSGGSDPGRINRYVKERFGLSTQLLHACRVEFSDSVSGSEELGYLAGRSFEAAPPRRFTEILRGLEGK